jgi:hypothetical protein
VTAAIRIGDSDGAPTFGHPRSLPRKANIQRNYLSMTQHKHDMWRYIVLNSGV